MSTTLGKVFLLSLGCLLRIILYDTGIQKFFSNSYEFNTPFTSWKHVTEGVSLKAQNIDPYHGDTFHSTPILLWFLRWSYGLNQRTVFFFFVVADIVMALLLSRVSVLLGRCLLLRQKEEVGTYHANSEKQLLNAASFQSCEMVVLASYIFNPLAVGSCIALSLSTLHNLILLTAILLVLEGHSVCSIVAVAFLTFERLYPFALLPAFLLLSQTMNASRRIHQGVLCFIFLVSLASFFGICYILEDGSWDFVCSVHQAILTVPDLTPNLGLFWYFFTEMFDHFRSFFLAVFQLNAFIYSVPLYCVYRAFPEMQLQLLLMLCALLQAFPCYADLLVPLSLVPVWKFCFPYTRVCLIGFVMVLVAMVMAPILRVLWLESGSANANFYYTMSIVYNTGWIICITDVTSAFLRRKFALENGLTPEDLNTSESRVMLR